MKKSVAQPIRPDWISKTLAGIVAGLSLAFALVGLFAWHGPGGISGGDKAQLNMWLTALVWLVLFSLTYLFRSGARAWLWLGGLNLLTHAALWLSRQPFAGA